MPFSRMKHMMWHHYHKTDKEIRRMSLRNIVAAIDDISSVNPMCSAPEEDAPPPGPPDPTKDRYGSIGSRKADDEVIIL